jgi:hypothetical protein
MEEAPMAEHDKLRDWKERNQGHFPKADPCSKNTTEERDIAKPDESDAPNGDVAGEPGASGTDGSGVHGSGSRGGTGSPNSDTRR